MRKTASEIINDLEERVSFLEKESSQLVRDMDFGVAELCYTGKSSFDRSAKCLQPKFNFKSMKIIKESNGKFDWDGNSVLGVSDLSVASPDGFKDGADPRVCGWPGRALVFRPYRDSFILEIGSGGINRWVEFQEKRLGVSVRSAKVVDIKVPKNSFVDYTPHASHMREGFLMQGTMTLSLTVVGSRQKELVDIRFKAFGEAVIRGSSFATAWAMLRRR